MPKLNELVEILKAVGEPTRLRILALMATGELSVKDLTDILDQSQPRVSRHLKLLADAGLAVRHAEGAWAYYSLSDVAALRTLVIELLDRMASDDEIIAADRARLALLRQAQGARAAAYFATVAQDWDVLRSLHVPETEIETEILAAVAGRRLRKVVDFGTGTGRMLELLAPHYQTGLGLDSSREMIAVARAKLAEAGVGHAHVRAADIAAPIGGAASADLVVLHQVLHYFDDPAQVLAQAARVLGPGGEVIVVDFAPHGHEFLRAEHAHRRLGLSEAQMQGWAQKAGLDVAAVRFFDSPDGRGGLTVCLWRLMPGRSDRHQQGEGQHAA